MTFALTLSIYMDMGYFLYRQLASFKTTVYANREVFDFKTILPAKSFSPNLTVRWAKARLRG